MVTVKSKGKGSLSARWQPPALTGGLPGTGYQVSVTPGKAACSVTTTSCTVSELKSGSRVTVTVTALNEVGGTPAHVKAAVR